MPRATSQRRATRNRKVLWGALAGVLLLGAFLLHERGSSRGTEDEARRPELEAAPVSRDPGGPASSRLPPAPAAAIASPAPAPPIIDEIRVEKPEVCEGEENLVTVRAHTPDGNDAFLHYQIGTHPGPGRGLALLHRQPGRAHPSSRGRVLEEQRGVLGRRSRLPREEMRRAPGGGDRLSPVAQHFGRFRAHGEGHAGGPQSGGWGRPAALSSATVPMDLRRRCAGRRGRLAARRA
jgi:hypothetical protein